MGETFFLLNGILSGGDFKRSLNLKLVLRFFFNGISILIYVDWHMKSTQYAFWYITEFSFRTTAVKDDTVFESRGCFLRNLVQNVHITRSSTKFLALRNMEKL